jgi:hypothetical protein
LLLFLKISITPALSCIESYKESRVVNLVWTVRDPSMLVFFLENAKLDEKGLNFIFYTGKEKLPEVIENFNVTAHVKIIYKRPDLSILLPKIIAYFERRNTNTAATSIAISKDKNSPILEDVKEDVESGSGTCFAGIDKEVEQKVIPERVLRPSTDTALEDVEEDEEQSSRDFNTPKARPRLQRHSVWNTNSQWMGPSLDLETLDEDDQLWDEVNKPRPVENAASQRNLQTRASVEILPSSRNLGGESSKQYTGNMTNEKLERWGFMYCGSRNPLLTSLVKESKKLGIPLHEEAFDW